MTSLSAFREASTSIGVASALMSVTSSCVHPSAQVAHRQFATCTASLVGMTSHAKSVCRSTESLTRSISNGFVKDLASAMVPRNRHAPCLPPPKPANHVTPLPERV